MNYSTAAKLVISLVILTAGCGRLPDQSSTVPTAEQPSAGETRRPTAEELKTIMPPKLQGPSGPYTNARSSP